VIALVALLACSTVASASALDLLEANYQTLNNLEDVDYEGLLRYDEIEQMWVRVVEQPLLPLPIVDDVFVGMWEVQRTSYDILPPGAGPEDMPGIDPRTPTTHAFTAVFALQVADEGIDPVTGDPLLYLQPLSLAQWQEIIDDGHMTPLAKPTVEGSVATVFDDSVQDGGTGVWTKNNVGTWPADFATAVDTVLWEVGFRDGDEFWTAFLKFGGDPELDEIEYEAALNTTLYGAGMPLLKHDRLLLGVPSEWQLSGKVDDPLLVGDLFLKTDTDIWILPTPEPGTFALLGLGLAAFGGVLYRRRRK
jgi:hypothetical protein